MSEPHAEPQAADVRSFLPRPGEPVEEYAARLRALHEDLTLVLDAVERGLAAAEAEPVPLSVPVAVPAPVAAPREPLEVVPEPHRSQPPPGPLSPPRGNARVEVVSTTATAHGDSGGEQAWSGPPEPQGGAPRGGRRAPMGEEAPAGGMPAASSPARWPAEPWVESAPPPPRGEPWVERAGPAPREPWTQGGGPAWAERPSAGWPSPPPPPAEMTFQPPAHAPFAAPPRRRDPALSPLFLAAALIGWLTAIALVIALAFGL